MKVARQVARWTTVLIVLACSVPLMAQKSADNFSAWVQFRDGKIVTAANFTQPSRLKIGLVLSGGGSRGMYHIGVLKALEKKHIPIDLIVGTSIGSVIGGLYASGYTPDEILKLMKRIKWETVYRDETQRAVLYVGQKGEQDRYLLPIRFENGSAYIPEAYSPGQKVLTILTDLILRAQYQARDNFDNLKIPFRAVCTDLVSGRRVVLNHGSLAEGITASLAMPLLFSPIPRDSMLLVDGGLRSNLPVSVAREKGMQVVLAVDVASGLRAKEKINAPWEIVDQATTIMSETAMEIEEKNADILIKPQLGNLLNSDFSQTDALVRRGEEEAYPYISRLQKILASPLAQTQRKFRVDSIQFINIQKLPLNLQRQRAALPDSALPLSSIKHDVNLFLNDGAYNRVSAKLNGFKLIWALQPWPALQKIHFEGVTRYSKEALKRILFLREGQRFNHRTLQRDLKRVIQLYRRDGYSLARISGVQFDASGVLHIAIDEGVIRDVLVSGNKKTHDYVIKREFSFQKGKVFNWKPVATALQNTYATQLFKRVGVDVRSDSSGNMLKVKVAEKASVLLRIGGKFDTDRRAQAYLEFGDDNFLGRGVRAMLAARFGNRDGRLALNIRNDRIWMTYFTFAANVYRSWELNTYRGWDGVRGGYREERTGLRLQIGQQVRRIGQLVFELRQENIKDSQWRGEFSQPLDIELRTFALRAVTDKRDRIDFPTKGIFNHWAFESGNRFVLETKELYTKALVNLEGYYTFRGVNTWHLRAFVGLGDRTLPFSENFRLGGMDSFYGLSSNEYFGRQMVLASAEYRFQLPLHLAPGNFIFKKFFFSVRYDFGGIWENPALVFSSEDFFSGFGAAFSMQTLFGPMHLAYGRTTRGAQEFYFSLGFNY